MSDIVDDLLQEVEQLEETTQELESTTRKVSDQNEKLSEANSNASAEANLLALEAAKTAQDASTQSHLAAKAAIKQAETLKAQALELNESNFNWRQAVRNAAKDFQAAKGSFTIMMTTAIIFSLITLGAMGYLFYSMKKEEAKFKGEVLDIITTENALLNKKMTLKIDELASVVESLSFEVSKINQGNPVKITQNDQPVAMAAATEEPVQKTEEPVKNTADKELEQDKKATPDESVADKAKPKAEMAPQVTHTTVTVDTKELQSSIDWVKQHSVTQKEFTELKGLVEKVLAAQKTLEAQTQKVAMVKGAPATSGLTAKQVKKLNDISWLIRKQGKTLKGIEAKLGVKPGNVKTTTSNNTVLNELKKLHNQQAAMQKQINEMQGAIDELSQKAKTPAPYSYKAK